MQTRSGTPARTRLRTVVRRKSCGIRLGTPARAHALHHHFGKVWMRAGAIGIRPIGTFLSATPRCCRLSGVSVSSWSSRARATSARPTVRSGDSSECWSATMRGRRHPFQLGCSSFSSSSIGFDSAGWRSSPLRSSTGLDCCANDSKGPASRSFSRPGNRVVEPLWFDLLRPDRGIRLPTVPEFAASVQPPRLFVPRRGSFPSTEPAGPATCVTELNVSYRVSFTVLAPAPNSDHGHARSENRNVAGSWGPGTGGSDPGHGRPKCVRVAARVGLRLAGSPPPVPLCKIEARGQDRRAVAGDHGGAIRESMVLCR